jgi:probable addiction module antidote protein
MPKPLTTYAPAAALVNDEEIAFFLANAFEIGNVAFIAKALGVVARAKARTELSDPQDNARRDEGTKY